MKTDEAFVTGMAAGVLGLAALLLWPSRKPQPVPVPVPPTKQIPPPHEDLDEYVGFDRDWWTDQLAGLQ